MKKILSLVMAMIMVFTLVACGTKNLNAEKYCWSCGGGITKQARFCEYCGVSVNEGSMEVEGSSSNDGTVEGTQTPTTSPITEPTTTPTTAPTGEPTTEPTTAPTGEPTTEPTTAPTDEPTTCEHSWFHATCTNPMTCEKCGLTEGEANGHWWYEATCTDPRICTVCMAEDPDSEPLGHLYIDGACTRCGESDPNNIQLTLSASNSSLYLDGDTVIVYITMTGADVVVYDIDNTDVVYCEWGEWDGDTIPLYFHPVSSGETYVTVYPEGYDDKGITIYVTVDIETPAELTTLTIEGEGNEFKQYITGLPNTNKLHSVTYEIEPYVDDEICIWIDYVVSCIECVEYNGYIRIRYNLYNSSGVVVETGETITEFTHTNTQYAGTMVFSGLPADDYTLVFSDSY